LLIAAGVLGAALLYGDIMITPAISIMSAIEGVGVVDPAFKRYVIPLAITISILLFALQCRGTARVAAVFGPVMLMWFI
jgi:KUP system potassium uptake protein